MRDLSRIADALERIASVLEGDEPSQPVTIRVNLDGKEISHAVIRHTLARANRGPSSLVGGSQSHRRS